MDGDVDILDGRCDDRADDVFSSWVNAFKSLSGIDRGDEFVVDEEACRAVESGARGKIYLLC